ncbi:hypothetical protein BDP27DRAFT_1225772, partial [Rhodocollybia butyracea]
RASYLALLFRRSYTILDSNGVVSSVVGGHPQDTRWLETVNQPAAEAIRQARSSLTFSEKQTNHRRADCPSVAFGVSFGRGAKKPGNLHQANQAALLTMVALLSLPCFARISGFANCLFMAYAYQCYAYSKSTLDKLFTWNTNLHRTFKSSAWAACTINFGPFAFTYPHVNSANLCFGWCSITALGNFDPKLGGHLILWDLGLFIRFSPGSTILIPLALLVHSNIPVAPGEERYSFVQYSSTGIFCWVENGFQSNVDFESYATASQRSKRKDEQRGRWGSGLRMFLRWVDIQAGNWKGSL